VLYFGDCIDKVLIMKNNEFQMGGTLDQELARTAELLVEIANRKVNGGVFFAVAFLYDAQYDRERIKKLLPYLQKQSGSIINLCQLTK
jgi:hypothetical protein